MIGKKYGRLTVLGIAPKPEHIKSRTKYVYCKCDCGNPEVLSINSTYLKNGHTLSCGCLRSETSKSKAYDLTGKTFGKLTVLYRNKNRITKGGFNQVNWHCICSCDNHTETDVDAGNLLSGHIKSCGCLKGKRINRSFNNFEIIDNYVKATDNSGKYFYFDLEYLELVKKYYWFVEKRDGYVLTSDLDGKKITRLHQFLFKNKYCDHIDTNKKYDNRKCNLRFIDTREEFFKLNNLNHKLRKDNKSGFTGVNFDNKRGKWVATIRKDGHNHHLGSFNNKDDAIKARLIGEDKYFGEFGYHNSQAIAEQIKIS